MNPLFLYDQRVLIQQQLLLQQLAQYNQMMALRNACSFHVQQCQQIQPQSPLEIKTNEQKTIKNDEINDELSSFELSKSLGVSKAIKKSKETKSNKANASLQQSKKRIFLSMKDIRDVQYKKQNFTLPRYKITNDNQNTEVVKNKEEKN
ncbi:unnamed protein product (macronuclear) [Paramecium tetraurelia]|uniref:Uncharacterized protein n=1 Tax=Paramecium tetraurelia TaxID=5888 RepID=A0CEZ4_PARTE|nr:uncharacterized protein GSPATT00037800001 [Paramecium tetraurelia]CAK69361.1 unnamed protein product [Paramecium tetraurelia]|eukprot:XP_001436758.1 hypothetical protein (macronuclear) [Paramecium tetraurelia strain d4-2]